MLIRCEKCSTTYELDEAVLPPQGAPVQCSRCQFVFTVRPQPAAAPAATPKSAPASASAPTSTSTSAPAPAPAPTSTATANSTPTESSTSTQQFTADGRPIRKVTMKEEEPAPTGPRPAIARVSGGVPVRPIGRRGVPWLPIAVAALAVGAVAFGWRAWSRRSDPVAAQRSKEGQALMLRDDRRSLTLAVVAFDDAARLDDGSVDRRADRVAARALLIGLVEREAAGIERRLAATQAEKTGRAATAGPPPPGVDEQLAALRSQRETALAQLRELEAVASAELAPLLRRDANRPPVQRAHALLDAFGSDPARAAQAVLRDRPVRGKDPWIDLAAGAGETRAVSPELRAEGMARLEQLVKAHPEILRARLVLAEALSRAGRVEAALASLDALLAANKAHDDARALRDELAAPAARPSEGELLPASSPTPGAPAPQPRNESSHAPAGPSP